MLKLPALLLAAAALPLQAAPLVARDAIFPATYQGRPAISSSGKWLAVEGFHGKGLRMVPTSPTDAAIDIALPDGMAVYWYRWANRPADVLTVGAGGAYDALFSYDVAAAKLTPITSQDMEPSLLVALPTNNFAFTFDRFREKASGALWDLGSDGALHRATPSAGEIPGYLPAQQRYFRLRAGPRGWEISAGVNEKTRARIVVGPEDQRQGGGLMSLSGDGAAYVLAYGDSDTLELVSIDLASAERKVLAHAPADIRRVILDPVAKTPDAIEYDDGVPQLRVLNQKIAADIKLLASRGDGLPSIADRSPNDRFWVVQYAHREGTARLVLFDRQTHLATPLPKAAFAALESPDWRVRPFTLPGKKVSGYVTLPREGLCETTRCPAVLRIHGGPGERDYAKFDYERFWLTSRGIAVISVNYRGSRGFGKSFMAQDARQWADGIPDDVTASLEHVLASFPIDRRRVAGMGTSFGGYLTLHLAARGLPLRCAVIDSASTDIPRFADRRFRAYGEGSDILKRVGDARVAQEKAAMVAMSPSSHIEQLATMPILHFQGSRDDITFKEDNAEFVAAMLSANPDYTHVEMPNENHGLLGARAHYREISEAFLGKCLGVPAEPASAEARQAWAPYRISGNIGFLKP